MALRKVLISSILNGQSSAQYFGAKGQYNSALGIDPDHPVSSQKMASGAIVPVAYSKFSGANISDFPKWMITNNKNSNIYVYNGDGKFVSYNSSLGSETLVGTPTSGAGNGAAYYNNYIYLTTPTDVSRYGPLDNSPSLTNNWWTSTLSLTALTNTTYPSLRGTAIPNHAMHVHGDNSLYFCDYKNGQGLIHRIHTKKVTDEGDTDDTTVPSSYNVLDLPFGYYPVAIESFDTDLAILAIRTTDTTINQGNAAIFFWDTISSSFNKQVPIPDPIATSIKMINGVLYVFSGNASGGTRVSAYLGGSLLHEVMYLEESTPPLAGAVDVMGDKLFFGGWSTYPETSACVFSLRSKKRSLPPAIHCPVRTTVTSGTPAVTSLKLVQQADFITPKAIVGHGNGSAYGIDKLDTSGTINSVFRSEIFQVNREFTIQKVRISLGKAVAANMEIIPKFYFDDDISTGSALTTINNTNYTNSETNIVFKQPVLSGFRGKHNFMFELNFGGTVNLPVLLPVEIYIDILDSDV